MWYDLFILAVLVFFTISGAARGVVWQIAGITGIILCFAFADALSTAFGPYVHLAPPLNHWAVLFAAYLVFSFLSFGIARMLNEWIEKHEMKEFNRHLGAAFGLLKGVILSLIITFLVVTVSGDAREALKQSRSGYYAAHIMNRLHPVMPAKLHDALADYIHLLDDEYMDLPPVDHHHEHDDGITPLGTGTPVLGESSNNPFNISNPFNTNNSATPTSLGQPGTIPANNGQPVTLEGFFNDVKGKLSSQAKTIVQDAFQNQLNAQSPATQQQLQQLQQIIEQTPTRDLATLQKELINAGAGRLDQFIAAKLGTSVPTTNSGQTPSSIPANPPPSQPINPWANFGATTPAQPTPPSSGGLTLDQAITQFTSQLSSVPAVQQGYAQQIKQQLAGIPGELVVPVLNDWKADILNPQADPDPTTNKDTPTDVRVYQAAQRAGFRFDQFTPEWQQRIRAVFARSTSNGNLQ